MPVVCGTNDGVIRLDAPDGDPERELAAGTTRQVRRLGDACWAATDEGVFRSPSGRNWTDAGVPEPAAAAVAVSPDGRHYYAGTRPAHVYVSSDGGDAWTRSETFAALPGREDWENLGGVGPQVRALAVHPDAPDRLVAGVEAAGVHVSPDRGETWERRSTGLHDDVHDLTAVDRDTWVAACGRGVYRTTDAGRSWQGLDTGPDQFWYTYHRETALVDGVLWDGAQDRAAARHDEPEVPGLLQASTDGGATWRQEPFPGDEDAFPVSWATHDGGLLAGCSDGRLLARTHDEWHAVNQLAATVRSLAAW